MTIEIGTIDDRRTDMEALLGHDIGYVRIFHSNSQTSAPPQSYWTNVQTVANLGYVVHVSFKPVTANTTGWNNIAANSENARWTAIGNFLATIPQLGQYPNVYTLHHEMDNDGTGGNDTTDGAAFQAAFNKVTSIIGPLAGPGWMSCVVYSNGTFMQDSTGSYTGTNGNLHGGPYLWYPSSAEAVGHDYYYRRSSGVTYANSTGSELANFTANNLYTTLHGRISSHEFAVDHGVPLFLPEFGINVKDPAVDGGLSAVQANRAGIISAEATAWKANCPSLRGISYYDRGFADGFRPYSIAGGSPEPACTDPQSIAAFDSFAEVVVPPSATQKLILID